MVKKRSHEAVLQWLRGRIDAVLLWIFRPFLVPVREADRNRHRRYRQRP